MKRLLIVDDSAVVRRTLRTWLEQRPGWEVCGEAENGIEGIQQAMQLRPDLIVMDTSMPTMNGFEASKEINRKIPETPIVMFTAFMNSQVEKEARASGVATIKSKFESIESLSQSIQSLLPN